MAGRLVGLVGVACGLVAIWARAFAESYWADGTLGTALLVLTAAAGLMLAGALATGRRDFDFGAAVVGGLVFGLYLFSPVIVEVENWGQLGSGAFLGLCTALIVLGALAAYWATPVERGTGIERNAPAGALVALAGAALAVVSVWLTVDEDGGTYWSTVLGHAPGIALLVLAAVSALLVAGAYAGASRAGELAVVAAAITLGFASTLIVANLFDSLGVLRVGAWLAFAGGALLLVGTIVLRGAPLRVGTGAPLPAA